MDEEVGGLVDAELAAVHADVQDDPARSPDRIGVHDQPERRIGVEAALPHEELRIHPPALDEFRGLGQHPGQRRVASRLIELQVMTRVRLVDARVADRREVVLLHGIRVAVDGGVTT